MMAGRVAEGRCQCGAVRLKVLGEPETVVYCHCVDCRRWSGAPVVALAGYKVERVEIRSGTPKGYDSSPGVRRSFCEDCGTPLSYEDARLPGEIYISVGVFDEPELFEPDVHSWTSQSLSWLDIRDDLPRHEKSSRPR